MVSGSANGSVREALCSFGRVDRRVQAFVDLVPALEDLHSPSRREDELGRWAPMMELLFVLVRSTAAVGWADLATGLAGAPVSTGRSALKSKTGGEDPPVLLPLAKRPRASRCLTMGNAAQERCGEHAAVAGDPKAAHLCLVTR